MLGLMVLFGMYYLIRFKPLVKVLPFLRSSSLPPILLGFFAGAVGAAVSIYAGSILCLHGILQKFCWPFLAITHDLASN